MRAHPVLALLFVVGCNADPVDTPDAAAPLAEAGPDVAVPDGAIDAQADAAVDAPSDAPAVCTEAGRFTPATSDAGTALTVDATTGLRWTRDVVAATAAYAPQYCAKAGYRTPTKTELAGLLLRPGACVPALDSAAFGNLTTVGDVIASDGCVNFTDGVTKAACGVSPVYVLCVVP